VDQRAFFVLSEIPLPHFGRSARAVAIAAIGLMLVGCASDSGRTFTTASAAPSIAPPASASQAPAPATPVPAVSEAAPSPTQAASAPSVATPAPTESAPAPSESAPAPSETAPAASSPALDFTPGTKAAPRLIHIDTSDTLLFAPNFLVVAEGETVTFEVANSGKAEHEFMVGPMKAAFGDVGGTPEIAAIKAGKTKKLTFTFEGPGPFAFACHAPGHFEAGMLGYIQVVGPDVPAIGTAQVPRIAPITMSDTLRFDPDTEPVAPGETVSFVLLNAGTVTHEFAVGPQAPVDADEIDGTIVKEAADIAAGHVAEVTYTFSASGPFSYACHVPGHFEAGMKGSVTLP
jgi:uncharacterized cupredoxin-like copper-binding protein